jgi:hypothetical protein
MFIARSFRRPHFSDLLTAIYRLMTSCTRHLDANVARQSPSRKALWLRSVPNQERASSNTPLENHESGQNRTSPAARNMIGLRMLRAALRGVTSTAPVCHPRAGAVSYGVKDRAIGRSVAVYIRTCRRELFRQRSRIALPGAGSRLAGRRANRSPPMVTPPTKTYLSESPQWTDD